MTNTQEKFYITTTLPYVNAEPHLGFALEIIQADIIARYQKLLGKDVFFNTGTDEHGSKIHRKALEQGKDTQAYVDEFAEKFRELKDKLNLFEDLHFIRTTDTHHKQAAQEFWKRCNDNGYIEKKNYSVKYCIGCELEKTDSDLVEGKCPIHPNLEIELIEEENYFFLFSKFQKQLLDLYEQNPDFVVPDFRFNEIKKFVEGGLSDFSISRLKEKMPWGVPVPGDNAQVMYVWFDALVNYISTLGWPEVADFNGYWPGIQIAGKDNLRQQSAMWQAMLMAAGLPNSKQIIIHGFIESDGQKMSKSLGNVINPFEIVEKYGVDSLRYWVAREANTFEDSDFTWDKFKESYNANLANGLGNLVSRIMKMAISNDIKLSQENWQSIEQFGYASYSEHLDKYEIKNSADIIWDFISSMDKKIQKEEPFKVIKVDVETGQKIIHDLLIELARVSKLLQPFMPETAEKILKVMKDPTLENIPRLFPRVE